MDDYVVKFRISRTCDTSLIDIDKLVSSYELRPIHVVKDYKSRTFLIILATDGYPLNFELGDDGFIRTYRGCFNAILLGQYKIIQQKELNWDMYSNYKTFKVEQTCSYYSCPSFVTNYMGNVDQVDTNKLGTIIRFRLVKGDTIRYHSLFEPSRYGTHEFFYLEDNVGKKTGWLNFDMLVLKSEMKWIQLKDKLLERQRMERKMHPQGEFMKKMIEKDKDFL